MIKFLENLRKKHTSQKGVSLITLVITIIVVIILASLAISGNIGTVDEATVASYKHELKDVEVGVSATRINNQKGGIGEEFKETGFYPIIIENPPENFVSFGEDEFYGYIVDLDYIDNEETKKGFDYKKYINAAADQTITFGKQGRDNDVYIYDATGKVFYAKGLYVEGGVYYSDVLTKDGPIISIEKIYNDALNVVELSITVTPVTDNPTNITLRINNSSITSESDGTYKYTATTNDTYLITAEEDIERVSIKRVKVSEILEGEYNIVYHYQDGVTPDKTVIKYGSQPIRLKTAKREGYTLVGWSKLPSSAVKDYDPGALFAENVDTDLYAVWEEGEPREFTITFNANGGYYEIDNITKIERTNITIPSEIPTRDSHIFKGWSNSSTATQGTYLPGDDYSEEGDATLFAIWEKGDIRVEIEVNPIGAGTAVGGGLKEDGSIVYITAVPNAGYSFYKWTVESSNIRLANNYAETTKFTMPNAMVKLVANFKETDYDYTIKYNANNGSGAPNTQYKKHGENISLSTMIPTRSAHTFEGWSTSISSNIVEYLPGSTYSMDKNVTLYAVWRKNTEDCTLTFDANGGTNGPSSIIKTIGSIITIPSTVPTRSNLIFLGWAEDKNSKEPDYRKNDYYTMSGDATLYAVWSDSEKPIVSITAEEKDNNLILNGIAVDNGGIVSYAWTNQFYSSGEQGNITWTDLNNSRSELKVPKEIIKSGLHCFYAKDENGNVSYASIDVYKLTFYADGTLVDTKYKAAGYGVSLTEVIPEKATYVFSKWKSNSDNRIYNDDEKYLLNKDESFSATWDEAMAYIPSTNKYYLTMQHAVNAVPENTSDYVLIELIRNETSDGAEIKNRKMVSLSTGTNTLNANQTAISIEAGSKFKLIDGTINATVYGIRNNGTLNIDSGKITAPNGIYNTGTAVVGKDDEAFSRESVVISSTSASYQMTTGATLYFTNGKFVDYKNDSTGTTHNVPTSGLTLRNGFEIRKIGNSSSSAIVTTLVEDLVMTTEVLAGSTLKPVEIKVTLSCSNTNYTFQHSTDNLNWVTGTTIILIDNATVYGRILEDGDVANTEQLTVNNIVDLTVTFNGGGVISNPTSKTVKYKRTYGTAIPTTTDTTEYYFKGWWTASSGGTQVTSTSTVTIAEDHTLYAHWEGKPFTVTFDANGGSVSTSSKTVRYGSTYGTLPTPSKNSYDFDGWFTSSSGGTHVYSSTTVNKAYNHTLYAQWTRSYLECSCCGGNWYTCPCSSSFCSTCGLCTNCCSGHTSGGEESSSEECLCCGGDSSTCGCSSSICDTCGKCTIHCPGHTTYTQCSCCKGNANTCGCTSSRCSTCGLCTVHCSGHESSETGTQCTCCGTISCTTCSSSYCSTCNKCLVHCPGHVCPTCNGDGGWYEDCSTCGGTGTITSSTSCPYCTNGTVSYTCPSDTSPEYPYGPGQPIYDGCGGDGYFVKWCRTCWGNKTVDGKTCTTCNGSGYADPPTVECTRCNGTGTVTESCQNCGGDGNVSTTSKCSNCSNGRNWRDCPNC